MSAPLNLPGAVSADDMEATPRPVLDRLLFLERHVGQVTQLNDQLRDQLAQTYERDRTDRQIFADAMERMAQRLAHQQYRARLYKARWLATKGNQQHVDATP